MVCQKITKEHVKKEYNYVVKLKFISCANSTNFFKIIFFIDKINTLLIKFN